MLTKLQHLSQSNSIQMKPPIENFSYHSKTLESKVKIWFEDSDILQTFTEEQLRFILSLQDKRNWGPRVQLELAERIANPKKKQRQKVKRTGSREGMSDILTSRNRAASPKQASGWKPYKGKKSSKQGKSNQGEKAKLYKPGPRDIGRNKNWKPAKFDTKKQKSKQKSHPASSATAGAPPNGKIYKPGPRDIGRNKDWKPANYGIDLKKIQEEDFLKPKINGKRSKPPKGKDTDLDDVPAGSKFKVYKQGPRDIGRVKGWKPANYGIDLKKADQEDFLKPKTSGKVKVDKRQTRDAEIEEKPASSKFQVYKQGPRDIGRNTDWKGPPANYGIDLKKLQNEDFLKPKTSGKTRVEKRKTRDSEVDDKPASSKFKVYKQGPRDIGRNTSWKPANYGIDLKKSQGEDFLKPRLDSRKNANQKKKKKASKEAPPKKIYKPGPRDIGRMKGWKPAKYDIKGDDSTFLKPRLASAKKISEPTNYKPGPRDVGRNKKYKAAEYDIKNDDKEFLSERVRPISPQDQEVPAKLGPVEIGRQKDFKPPEYDVENDDKDFLSPRVPSSTVTDDEDVSPKLGPIEIGRNEDYVPAKYDLEI